MSLMFNYLQIKKQQMFKCISLQGSVDCNLVSLDTCKPPPQPNTSHMIGEGGLGKIDLAS